MTRLVAQARRLEYIGIGWTMIEAGVSLGAGVAAGSSALLGFGLDSVVEGASAVILLWRLQPGRHGVRREAAALRLVGVAFLLLAAFVAIKSARALLLHLGPESSPSGIAITALSLVVMPWLAARKRRIGDRLASRALTADSRQSTICAYLSAIVLAGLLLNATLGWWWADPAAALALVPIVVKEGVGALRGEVCTDCHADLAVQPSAAESRSLR